MLGFFRESHPMRYILCLFITVSFLTPARATPPESLSLMDRVIGISATQVFILREVSDNLGLYAYGMRDIYLVAKNATSGEEEDIWPVYRVYAANTGANGIEEIKAFPLEAAVNPYDILGERAAKYLGYGFLDLASEYAPAGGLDEDALWVEGNSLENADLMAQISQSLGFTSSAVRPYPESGFHSRNSLTPQEMFASPEFTPDDCSFDGVMTLYRDPAPDVVLANISCLIDDRLSISLAVVVPE